MPTTIWADSVLNMSTAGGGSQSLVNLGLPALSTLQRRIERFTLIRTIIGIDIGATVRDSGEGDQSFALGIGIFPEESDTVAELPDPRDDQAFPERGWIWRGVYRVYAVAVGDQNVSRNRVDLDIRGQRKVENGRPRLISKNQDDQGVSTAVTVSGMIRMLFLVG